MPHTQQPNKRKGELKLMPIPQQPNKRDELKLMPHTQQPNKRKGN
jgi:hypothetical protein